MNVKFRIPKFGSNMKGKGWLRELVMTFLGTTISIVLTFGTAQYLENRQKVANGRLMAMMVIHDMDNTIETLTKLADEHEKIGETALYLMEDLNRIDSVSVDTLAWVLDYIVARDNSPLTYRLDESTEKVFLSSQDSWKSINNATFIDEVQRFYVIRHELYHHINSSSRWKKPVGEDAFNEELKKDLLVNPPALLRKFLVEDDVKFFINMAVDSKQELNTYAYLFKQISDRCKFTMGITDEELTTYIETRKHTGNNVKEDELIGAWIVVKTTEYDYILEYASDHTYQQTSIIHQASPLFNGCIDTKYITNGTWELRADTLLMVRKPGVKFEMDDSNVTPKAGMEQKAKDFITETETSGKEFAKSQEVQGERPRHYAASIDPTGNKIELRWTEPDANGNEVKQAHYLTKKKD